VGFDKICPQASVHLEMLLLALCNVPQPALAALQRTMGETTKFAAKPGSAR